MLKRSRALFIVLVVLLLGALLLVYLKRPKPVAVVIKQVDVGTVQDTVANTRAGTLKARHRARLSPSVGGQIAHLPVSKGDRVEAGQLLLELWNADLLAEVQLARQEARAAQARASEACVVADVAQRDARRLKQLFEKGVASEEQTDSAQGEAAAKAAACVAARASGKVSEAKLDVARALLDKTRLSAPFAGIVAEINGEVGEFVTPSPIGVPTPPAIDLVDTTHLYVSAPIDEVDAPAIRVGMPARISLDAFGSTRFPGTVSRVAPYVLDVEKQARTVDVEVNFDRPQDTGNMLPGYSADIEVVLAEHAKVLRIPTEAILEGNRVLVYRSDEGRLEQREITSGLHNWQYTEVLSGVEAGESVVVSVDRDGVEDGAAAVIEQTAAADD